MKLTDKVAITMTRKRALELGLLFCTCGHPLNNHFSRGVCAHCACEKYEEVSVSGTHLEQLK